ncbi:MAG: hypothetical protein U0T83_00565 [Bacteriovoracaceae bacterium]
MVLNEEQKEQFYEDSASHISHMIENFNTPQKQKSGYGNVGLNKSVKKINNDQKSSLDEFLKNNSKTAKTQEITEVDFEEASEKNLAPKTVTPVIDETLKDELNFQLQKIEQLEKKLSTLTKSVTRLEERTPSGLQQLRNTLKSLDIAETHIQNLIKKASFEFNSKDLENSDMMYEFALREMTNSLTVAMPLFSRLNGETEPCITVLVSEVASGQSSAAVKLASLKKGSSIIRIGNNLNTKQLSEEFFNIEIVNVKNIAEALSEIRKRTEQKKSIFVDYKNVDSTIDETKNFIDSLKRTFLNVEVLTCISVVHSEIYNKKILNKFKMCADGLILSHMDLCMNFGSIFNLNASCPEMPMVFFGTGTVVPDDIEAATAERILAGMFQLD